VHDDLLLVRKVAHAQVCLDSPVAKAGALVSAVPPGEALESASYTLPLSHVDVRSPTGTRGPVLPLSSLAQHCPSLESPRLINKALQESIAAAEMAVSALAALAPHRMRSPLHSAGSNSAGFPLRRLPLPSPGVFSHRDRSFPSAEATAPASSDDLATICLPVTPLAPGASSPTAVFNVNPGAVSLAGLPLEGLHSGSPNRPRSSPRPFIPMPAMEDGLSASPTLRELRAAHGAVGLAMSQLNRHLRLNFGKP
jgi:hypothetical protein